MDIFYMRTTKRFTPKLLERFYRLGRGQGIFGDYIPWHRVSRSDPSSQGRSHLLQGKDRQHELLSDHEWVAIMFVFMLTNQIDVREQFPLSENEATHELGVYRIDMSDKRFPGTLALAAQLGFKHPKTIDGDESANWVMTTDLVAALQNSDGTIELVAIAIKTIDEVAKKRTRELLAIERAYWAARAVPWLLITPALYDEKVGLNLRMQMPWTLGERTSTDDRLVAVEVVRRLPGRSLTFVLQQIEATLGDMDLAQRAFWQGVYAGEIPMSLRRGWRPHQPVVLLSHADFMAQNPIASRRSAWI